MARSKPRKEDLTVGLKEWVGTGVGLTVLAGVAWGVVAYFAPMTFVIAENKKLEGRIELAEMRQEQKIVGDQLYDTERRLDRLEERNRQYGTSCINWPDSKDREEYKKLQHDIEKLKKKQEILIQKTTK
jgi:uncharacterized membrane protein YhiD involved in acid resistance